MQRAIVVDSRWFGDPPGGVEAMIQLSIAMAAATSRQQVFVTGFGGLTYHDKWKRAYGDKLITQIRSISDMKKGDILFFNEGMGCEHMGKVPDGVAVYIYVLAAYRGCKSSDMHFISHNHYLINFENLRLPKERLIHPYLGESLIGMAHQRGLQHDGSIVYSKMTYRSKKRNLVLVDSDVPESIKRIIGEVSKSLGGESLVLAGLNQEDLIDAYESAKIVTDWCMRGSERCILEASLFGALVTVNHCETGLDFHDMPISAQFILNHTNSDGHDSDKENEALYNKSLPMHQRLRAEYTAIISRGFKDYWQHLDDFEPLRRSILSHNSVTMVKEAIRMLATHGLSPNEMEQVSAIKCVGC